MPLIWLLLRAPSKAGMAPSLPSLMRFTMKASLRVVPASLGPLPATRPPFSWQNPHVEAKSSAALLSLAPSAARAAEPVSRAARKGAVRPKAADDTHLCIGVLHVERAGHDCPA